VAICKAPTDDYSIPPDFTNLFTAVGLDIFIFPNPTSSVVYLQTASCLHQAVCRVLDVAGKVVQEKHHINGSGFAMDISGQATGL
jgi:hypothetical protein